MEGHRKTELYSVSIDSQVDKKGTQTCQENTKDTFSTANVDTEKEKQETKSYRDNVQRTKSGPPAVPAESADNQKSGDSLKRKISAPDLIESVKDIIATSSENEHELNKKISDVSRVNPQKTTRMEKSKSVDAPSNENTDLYYSTLIGSFENDKHMSTVPETEEATNISRRSELSPRHHTRLRHRSDGNLVYENKDVLDSVQEILMEEEKEWKRVKPVFHRFSCGLTANYY